MCIHAIFSSGLYVHYMHLHFIHLSFPLFPFLFPPPVPSPPPFFFFSCTTFTPIPLFSHTYIFIYFFLSHRFAFVILVSSFLHTYTHIRTHIAHSAFYWSPNISPITYTSSFYIHIPILTHTYIAHTLPHHSSCTFHLILCFNTLTTH